MADESQIEVWGQEDTALELVARACATGGTGAASPVTREGNLLKQADISSISVKAFNADTDAQNGATTALTVASVIYDTLQTSGVWGNIPGGGNLKFTAPATFFPDEDDVVIEVAITLSDASIIRGRLFLVHVQKVRGA